VLDLAKEKGQTVLTGKDAEKALGYLSTYYDLGSRCWEAPGGHQKTITYHQVLGKELDDKIVLAIDDKGETRKLVPKKLSDPILKTKKVKSTRGPDPWRAKQVKKHKEERLKNQAGALALAKIVEEVEGTNVPGLMPQRWTELLVQCAWRQLGYDSRMAFLVRRGRESPKDGADIHHGFKMITAGLTWRQSLGLLAELLLTPDMVNGGVYRSQDKERAEICEVFGIDFKGLLSGLKESKNIKGKKIKHPRAGSASDRSAPDRAASQHHAGQAPVANAPGSNGRAKKKAPPAKRWDITYETMDGETHNYLSAGGATYAEVCATAMQMPGAKRIKACEELAPGQPRTGSGRIRRRRKRR
jgi:hypothetical protein